METLRRLGREDDGFVVTIELILITTIVVLGLIAGLAVVRDAIVAELSDVAGSIQELNQSYRYSAATGPAGGSAGSGFADRHDWCDAAGDPPGAFNSCIQVYGTAQE